MILQLSRTIASLISTIGDLRVNGKAFCATLEPPMKLESAPNPKAIPAGTYEVIWRWSNRHKRWLPGLVDVPGHTDIEMHVGNTAADTDGCILVGKENTLPDFISESTGTVNQLFPLIQDACENGVVYINIFDPQIPLTPAEA